MSFSLVCLSERKKIQFLSYFCLISKNMLVKNTILVICLRIFEKRALIFEIEKLKENLESTNLGRSKKYKKQIILEMSGIRVYVKYVNIHLCDLWRFSISCFAYIKNKRAQSFFCTFLDVLKNV